LDEERNDTEKLLLLLYMAFAEVILLINSSSRFELDNFYTPLAERIGRSENHLRDLEPGVSEHRAIGWCGSGSRFN